METFATSLSKVLDLPIEHMNGLIALGALGLAAFTVFVVFVLAREGRKR